MEDNGVDTQQEHDRGHEHEHHQYEFMVDGKVCFSDQPILTGSLIKALAEDDPTDGLFIEGHGNHPDQQVGDTDSIDLREPHHRHFYTMPPANFGGPGGTL